MSYKDIKPLHFAISVENISESVKWYEEMLGFEFSRNVAIPGLPFKIAFIKKGDFEIEIFQHDNTINLPDERKHPNTDNQTQGNKHMCFYSPDVEGLLNELKSKGVDVIIGPNRVEDTTMGFIRDNNGIIIEFIGPASK